MKVLFIILAIIVFALLAVRAHAFFYSRGVTDDFPPLGDFVSVDGARIHVAERNGVVDPDAATVVLVHGASANLREFESNLVPALEGRVNLLSIDRPGHGYSGRTATSNELGEQARLIMSAVRERVDGAVVLVGHSFGGAVSLRLAMDYPEDVRGMVLLAPASHPWPGGTSWYNYAAANPVYGRAFADLVPILGPNMAQGGMVNVFAPNDVPDRYAENLGLGLLFRPSNFRANALDMVAANEEFDAQSRRYGDIAVPTVIFSPSKDHVLSPKLHAYNLSQTLQNVDLVVQPETGHMPHHIHTGDIAEAILHLARVGEGK